jgi:hypothetical protein
MSRIDPVQPPYSPKVAERLAAMMPPGVPPILLFCGWYHAISFTANGARVQLEEGAPRW